MTYTIKSGLLFKDEKQVAWKPSPNHGGVMRPTLLVMHYTAGQSGPGAISWLCNPKANASAHLVIDQAGTVTQLVNFGNVAWHAGVSEWGRRKGCNAFSIGIELVNPGFLSKRADGKFYDVTGKAVPAAQVVMARHKNGGPKLPWMVYAPAQLAEAVAVAHAITQAYGIKEVVGHEDVAPGRKSDPGPAFPMQQFVGKVLGRKE